MKTPLWETAKPFDFQILVSTGHHDWPSDAYDQPGTILPNIASFDFSKYGTVVECDFASYSAAGHGLQEIQESQHAHYAIFCLA